MNAVTQDFGPCPCGLGGPRGPYTDGCGVMGTKLQANGHLRGCACRPCIGRRNKRKGQRAEARAHKRLGGTGPTIRDDLFHLYSLDISAEVKTGGTNIPAKALAFLRSEWARHAFGQSTKKIPVGVDAKPAIILEVTPSESYAVVKLDGKDLR